MKKIFIFSFLIFLFSFFVISCHCQKKAAADTATSSEIKRDFEKEGYAKATVIYYELDACKYILQLVPDINGPDVIKQLEPTNLKAEFQKDQLAVWIKYSPKKDAMSACMAGQIIELSDIQLRK